MEVPLDFLLQHADAYVARQALDDDFTRKVKRAVIASLSSSDVTVEHIARRLGTSPRTIQRRLQDHGLSFKELVESTRFSLADRAGTHGILVDAGFTEVSFTDVHEPVFYGPDVEAAFDAVLSLWQTEVLLADLDAETTARALRRLRASIEAHATGDGVLFDSRAWIITAVTPTPPASPKGLNS
jgi:hypothetical protein